MCLQFLLIRQSVIWSFMLYVFYMYLQHKSGCFVWGCTEAQWLVHKWSYTASFYVSVPKKSLREIGNATDTSCPFNYKQSVAPGFLDFFLDQASKSDQDTSQCPFPQLCPGRKCRPLLRFHLPRKYQILEFWNSDTSLREAFHKQPAGGVCRFNCIVHS